MSELHLNIMSEYLRATDAQYTEGMEWYDNAHNIALDIAKGDAWKGAGVLAAYSINTKWNQNLKLAQTAFANGKAPTNTLGYNWRTAQRILNGEHPLDVLNGPKTRAFCSAIASPSTSTIATIDRHAYNIAMGTMDPNPSFTKKVFNTISDAYVECAEMAGISVCQIQAITWVSFRTRKGIK